MNKIKGKEKGITLIALVVTIIILLILAAIAINLTLGTGGLIERTKGATNKYEQAEESEKDSMSSIVAKMREIKKKRNEIKDKNTTEPDNPPEPPKTDPVAGEVVKTEDNIKYTSDGEGNIIPVPEGFTYTGEGTKETGFVIKNDVDFNEFVWIPTDLVEYKIYDWNKGSVATRFTEMYIYSFGTGFEEKNTQIVNEVTKSVNDNKGYYISRYEAGTTTKRTSTTNKYTDLPLPIFKATSVDVPVYAYNFISWSQSIYIGDKLYSKETNNVTSKLINSRGWDTALKFIETIGEDKDANYPTNSTNKGWYSNNKSRNSNYETGKSVDATNVTIPNKLKNIYDMAGNVAEWTADYYRPDVYSLEAPLRRGLFW